jgi:diacylglycerol kinase
VSCGPGAGGRGRSFVHAFRGIARLFADQPNARIQAGAAVAVVVMGLWLRVSRRDWAILVLTVAAVLGAEAMNTALEALADRVAPDVHPLVAKAKDAAAGGVLLIAIAAVVVGLLVLGPPLLARLR